MSNTPQEFVQEVLKYPIGREVHVCASWIEGGPPDEGEVGTTIEPEKELILHHTKSDLSGPDEKGLWTAGFRKGDRLMVRMRDMAVDPGRATGVLSDVIEEIDRHVAWAPRYTYRSPSFESFDLYLVRVRPDLFRSE